MPSNLQGLLMDTRWSLLERGVLDVRILHRFGTINGGVSELFGLDQAEYEDSDLTMGSGKIFTIGIGENYI